MKKFKMSDIKDKIEKGYIPPQRNLFGEVTIKGKDPVEIPPIFLEILEYYKNKDALFIPGNTPSLKNSKEIFQQYTGKSSCCNAPYIKLAVKQYKCTACNNACQLGKRPILVPSKNVMDYVESIKDFFVINRIRWNDLIRGKQLPIKIGFYFVRESAREFDFDNAGQVLQDQFKAHGWITDDSMINIMTYPLGTHKDKMNAGVYIVVLDDVSFKFGTKCQLEDKYDI
jgi:hypothetical protein